jgi:hypothetical protein
MSPKFRPGYFMLEVILALGVAAMVMYGVFALANGTMALSSAIADEGRDQISRESFLNFMGRNFEQLPGNAVLDLKTEEGGKQWLSEMTFQNVPTSFSWANQSLSPEAVQLATVVTGGDRINVVLRYYEEAILDDSDSTADLRAEPVAELVLLRNLYSFEWEVLDGRTMEQYYDWDIRGRLPLQVKLEARFSPEEDLVVHHFWIPPKANPETLMRTLTGGKGAQPSPTGGENGGGEGGEGPREGEGGQGNGTPRIPDGGSVRPPTPNTGR